VFFKKKQPLIQNDPITWKELWQGLVPEECRDVAVTVDGVSIEAFIQINQFCVMLQDGLLMEESFFGVFEHFQKAGYHVIWLMRCTQDIHNGFLKLKKQKGNLMKWDWKSPTTNFGRWTSDNFGATILIQHKQLPMDGPVNCKESVLQRVVWAESSDAHKMIPSRTYFQTVGNPGTPEELLRWLQGTSLSKVKQGSNS